MATPPTPPYQSPDPITMNCTGFAHNSILPLPMEPPIFQPVSWNAAPAKGALIPSSHAATAPMYLSPFEPIEVSFYPYQAPVVHPLYTVNVHKLPFRNGCRTNMSQQYYPSYANGLHDNHHMATQARFPTYSASDGRSVFIRNLSSDVNWHTLVEHLRAAGVVERCDIILEQDDNKPSGEKAGSFSATATFGTAEEAKRAVDQCDGSLLMGRRIRVRLDPNVAESPTSISSPASSAEKSDDLAFLHTNGLTPTPTSTLSSSSSSSSLTMAATDSKVNGSRNVNHIESRRDSGKDLPFHDKPDPQNKPDVKATTTGAPPPPPHQPLVVNGSRVRG